MEVFRGTAKRKWLRKEESEESLFPSTFCLFALLVGVADFLCSAASNVIVEERY